MSVGERIREVRKSRKLTQAQLAEKSGVAAISIHQYESGKRFPQLAQLIRIAAALGVNWNSLVTEDERTRIVMGRSSEKDDSLGVVVGGKIIAPNGLKSKYGVFAGEGIEAGGPVEIGLVVQGELARAVKAIEQMTEEGRGKVADYAEDILPRYRRQDPPEAPPAPAGDMDTPAAQDVPERAEEGE